MTWSVIFVSFIKNTPHVGEVGSGKNHMSVTQKQGVRGDNPDAIRHLATAFSLGISYSARIGGMASLTGTTNNLRGKDYIDELVNLSYHSKYNKNIMICYIV